MATGAELATAWVRIVPSLQGAQGTIAKELGPVADKEGKAGGKRFGAAMAGAIAGIVAPMASAALQGIRNMVGEMAQQVDSTKKFRSTLEFAGLDDSNIKRLTKTTKAYADQTVYGLSDIRNITAQLASNGVADYDRLAEAAGNLNAVAGGNAETFKSVGMVLTQTAGQGKLTAENWNQLSDAIPGASGKIQEALRKNGAFTGNFRDAMSKGQITAEEFNAVLLELGTDPVAVEAARSTATFEGALGNLQAGIVSAGAAILERLAPAFSVITGWLAERIPAAVERVMGSIDRFAAVVQPVFAELVGGIRAFGAAWRINDGDVTSSGFPGFMERLANAGRDVWAAIRPILPQVGELATVFFTAASAVGQRVWALLPGVLDLVSGALVGLAQGLSGVIGFLNENQWIVAGLAGAYAGWRLAVLGATIVTKAQAAAVAIATGAQKLWNAAMKANPIGIIITAISALVAALVWFFTQTEVGQQIWQNFTTFLVEAWDNIVAAAQWAWTNVLKPVLDAIGAALRWLWEKIISPIVTFVVNSFRLWGAIMTWLWVNAVQPALNAIGAALRWLWDTFVAPILNSIQKRLEVTGAAFRFLFERFVKPAFNNIQSVLSTVWKWIDRNVFTPFKVGVDLIGKAFQNGAKAIGKAWDGIKRAAANPINFVLDTVWNNGLRSFWNDVVGGLGLNDLKLPAAKLVKFAQGGVLPGYTPGRDVHQFYSPTGGRLALSGGEAIMRPEFTRLVGGARGVAALNASARRGKLAFKNGGVFEGLGEFAGDVWDNISKAAAVTGDFLTDPAGAIQKHVIDGIIRPLLGGGGDSVFLRAAGELPIKLVKGLIGRFESAPVGQGTKGMGWQAMWNVVKTMVPGAVMTSNFRPGAQTVNGTRSYHSLGRAIDIIPATMDMFNQVARLFPNASELIFSPAGGRQLLNGQPFNGWSNAVRRQHYNHIHLAMANGGVWPGLATGGTVTRAGHVVVGENGPEVLSLPRGAQVNPDYDALPEDRVVMFNNYAPLGQSPAQALTEFSNRAKGL